MINIGASTIGIGLTVKLNNQFSNQARQISNQFQNLYGNAQRIQAANLRQLRNMGIGMTIAGVAGTRALTSAYKVAADFDFTMRTIKVLTNASSKEFQQLEETITRLGTNSIYTIKDVASAVEYLVRQGFRADQALGALPGIVNLGAAAGGQPIGGKGGMADTMASIMHQFRLEATQSTRVANLLAKAANISSSDVSDIGQAMKYTAGQAHNMGYTIEQTVAMLATLSNAGLRGGVGGRSLNAMLSYLNRAASDFRTGRQTEAFKAIGLSISDIVDQTGRLKDPISIMEVFNQKLKSMTKVEQAGALSALFMMRGERSMFPLLERSAKVGYDFAGTYQEVMKNSAGYAAKISDYLMTGSKGTLMRLEDTFYAFKTRIGQILQPIIEPILSKVISFMQNLIDFSKTPLGKGVIILGAGLVVATAAAGALLTVFASVKLITLAGTVTAATLGKTLAWAWNSAAAAATRYALVARGVSWVGPGGVAAIKGMKGFQKVGNTGGATGMPGFFGTVPGAGKAGGAIGNATKALGPFARVIRLVTGPIGFIAAVLGGLFGFKNVIKSVVWGLGLLLNSVIFAGEALIALADGPGGITLKQAKSNFKQRQANITKSLGFDKSGLLNSTFSEENTRKTLEGDELLSELRNQAKEARNKKLAIQGVVNIDGKKVGAIMEERANLQSLLSVDIKN